MNDIRIHLHQDEDIQNSIESAHAETLVARGRANERALTVHIPSIGSIIPHIKTQHISIFCNLNGEFNIVDYSTGRVLYGHHPHSEVIQHIECWSKNAPYISLERSRSPFNTTVFESRELHPASDTSKYKIESLVIFGIGGGLHLLPFISLFDITYLIIYEPELQYLKASTLISDWVATLDLAKQKGTQIFLMIGKDGRDLVSDIEELKEHADISGFYIYKHYNHPIFQNIVGCLLSTPWETIVNGGLRFQEDKKGRAFKPQWTNKLQSKDNTEINKETNKLFLQNIATFRKYFPEIAKEFTDFEPDYWTPIIDSNGNINLLDKSNLDVFYDDPTEQGKRNKANFERYPNKDGVILGYNGGKLKDYLHYQYIAETEELLEQLHEAKGELPARIKSMILFGLGVGHELDGLLDDHEIEILFICEPNKDFFYASLFTINWSKIIESIDSTEGRIYINIGDDGLNLFKDLTAQFYSVGPYNLANTYFFQTYYNPALELTIGNLREHLKLIISMGEYYDHAKYGIAHTVSMIKDGAPLLLDTGQRQLSKAMAQVPVFLVGNGPSLDQSLALLKEYQDKAIIVSCGTSLMSLYKAGIVPDFHTEIEQNRATFDWSARVNDFKFLKKITLISCNGIHPDTASLFKQTLLAFKEGESSTASCLEILGKDNYADLKFAFPTVSNFSLNLFCELGFTQLYLFGVDLGYADNEYHHSKSSGYYSEQGQELYDFRAKQNTSIKTPGNFGSYVFTKQEFKVAKALMEQMLCTYKNVDVYNTSNGALIVGTRPLPLELILITSNEALKQKALQFCMREAFKTAPRCQSFVELFERRFRPSQMDADFQKLIHLVQTSEVSEAEAEKLIKEQRKLLFDSYSSGKSILLYLLHGTVNYTNAFFSKIVSSEDAMEIYEKALSIWSKWLNVFYNDAKNDFYGLDITSAFSYLSRHSFLSSSPQCHKIIFNGIENNKSNLLAYLKFSKQDNTTTYSIERVISLPCKIEKEWKNSERLIFCQSGGKLSHLKEYLNHAISTNATVSLFWQPWKKPLQSADSEQVRLGCEPIFFPGKLPHWLADIRKNFDSQALYIRKAEFVGEPNNKSELAFYFKEVIHELKEFSHFIDYEFYIALPIHPTNYERVAINSKGERGKQIFRPVTWQDLVLGVSEKRYTQLLKVNLYDS